MLRLLVDDPRRSCYCCIYSSCCSCTKENAGTVRAGRSSITNNLSRERYAGTGRRIPEEGPQKYRIEPFFRQKSFVCYFLKEDFMMVIV